MTRVQLVGMPLELFVVQPVVEGVVNVPVDMTPESQLSVQEEVEISVARQVTLFRLWHP